MTRYRFTGMVGSGVAILRGKGVTKKGEQDGWSPFSSGPPSFALELSADDMRAMGEKALLLAEQADEYKRRAEAIKAAPVMLGAKKESDDAA